MKKFFLSLTALMVAMTLSAQVVDGINYWFDTSDSTATVEAGDDYDYTGAIVIPATVTYGEIQYKVTAIGSEAFVNCEEMTSISLPDGLLSIETDAFWNCTGLSEITIPSTVTHIHSYAFEGCTGLSSLTLPESVIYIGGYILSGVNLSTPVYNSKLFVYYPTADAATTYTVPDGITTITIGAFMSAEHLQSVTLPTSIRAIEVQAFENCESLSSINLPEGLESIQDYAFRGTAIQTLALPASLTSVSGAAFPRSLQNISVAAGNTTYSSSNNCILTDEGKTLVYAAAGATLPEGITTIGSYAFFENTGITTMTIPSTVTEINEYAFAGCTNMAAITLPDSLDYLGSAAFRYCTSLAEITIPEGIEDLNYELFYECYSLATVNLPTTLKTIGSDVFQYCTSLHSLTLPDSVTYVQSETFNSSGLTSPVYNGKLFAYMPNSFKGAYTVQDGIETISDKAFAHCNELTEIHFPSSLKYIGDEAFDCIRLTRIDLPEGLEHIGTFAFEGCDSVETIVLPSTLTTIDYAGFWFGPESLLKEIYNYATTPQDVTDGDMFGCITRSECKLYVPAESIDLYRDATTWQDFDIRPIPATAIEHVQNDNVKTTKVLRNGQLLIERNGHIYNVQGTRVK
ncbi:MAG: leucine-rich repeat domain-containing protein [Paludibacteraceae bacterium]|nr:leucine-rich repeat domain-containing protein [Paludibacteraceae bacterium]